MVVKLIAAGEGIRTYPRCVRVLGLRTPSFAEQLPNGPETHPSARVKRTWLPSNMWNALLTHALRPQPVVATTTLSCSFFAYSCGVSAYGSFCQQRKEELAIVCSFSGECAAARVRPYRNTEGCTTDFERQKFAVARIAALNVFSEFLL